MDILTDVLDRVHLKGTVIFHYEFGRPWSVALPRSPDAIFHYLTRGSASIELEGGPTIQMAEGDFVLVVRGEHHVLRSGQRSKPIPLANPDRWPAHVAPRPSRRWAKAVFDDDVRSLQSVAPNARQCDGIATAGPALEARGRSTMAGDNPATDGDRGSASAPRPARGALANDRGALCRSAAQLDKIPWSGRRWLARRDRGSVHRQGASA
jgi:Cupin